MIGAPSTARPRHRRGLPAATKFSCGKGRSPPTKFRFGGAGGLVTAPVPVGEASARIALRILDGEDVSQNIPVTTGDFTSRPVPKRVRPCEQLRFWKQAGA